MDFQTLHCLQNVQLYHPAIGFHVPQCSSEDFKSLDTMLEIMGPVIIYTTVEFISGTRDNPIGWQRLTLINTNNELGVYQYVYEETGEICEIDLRGAEWWFFEDCNTPMVRVILPNKIYGIPSHYTYHCCHNFITDGFYDVTTSIARTSSTTEYTIDHHRLKLPMYFNYGPYICQNCMPTNYKKCSWVVAVRVFNNDTDDNTLYTMKRKSNGRTWRIRCMQRIESFWKIFANQSTSSSSITDTITSTTSVKLWMEPPKPNRPSRKQRRLNKQINSLSKHKTSQSLSSVDDDDDEISESCSDIELILQFLSLYFVQILENSYGQYHDPVIETLVDMRNISTFHGLQQPSITIDRYMCRFVKCQESLSEAACILACFQVCCLAQEKTNDVYHPRINSSSNHPFHVCPFNIHRLFCIAIMVSSKFFDDMPFDNRTFALAGAIKPCEIPGPNGLEVTFLKMLNHQVSPSTKSFKNIVLLVREEFSKWNIDRSYKPDLSTFIKSGCKS